MLPWFGHIVCYGHDPIGELGGINLYAYVGGNPVNFIDPDGRLFFLAAAALTGTGYTAAAAAVDAALIGAAGWWAQQQILNNSKNDDSKKKSTQSKPTDCPSGTKPIDKSGLGKDDIHDIKDGIGAGPKDWTGITPDGDVITTGADGKAVNHGPYDSYLP